MNSVIISIPSEIFLRWLFSGEYIAALGQSSFIYGLGREVVRVPRAATAFTAAAFVRRGQSETLMATTASRDVHEFDLDGEYTQWSNSATIPQHWRAYRSKIVSVRQFEDSKIILCDNESFTLLDRTQPASNKLRKIKSNDSKCELLSI